MWRASSAPMNASGSTSTSPRAHRAASRSRFTASSRRSLVSRRVLRPSPARAAAAVSGRLALRRRWRPLDSYVGVPALASAGFLLLGIVLFVYRGAVASFFTAAAGRAVGRPGPEFSNDVIARRGRVDTRDRSDRRIGKRMGVAVGLRRRSRARLAHGKLDGSQVREGMSDQGWRPRAPRPRERQRAGRGRTADRTRGRRLEPIPHSQARLKVVRVHHVDEDLEMIPE